MMKKFVAALLVVLLTGCEIEDDLEIRADGSGTYRARVSVERIIRPVLERIRADAERQGFRIVEEGHTFTTRYIVVRKDFDDVRALSGPHSNFDMAVEQRLFRRRYRLRATIASVAAGSFDRRFTITMPADVTSATAGGVDGRRVTWYCASGGSIDVVAEGFYLPLRPLHAAGFLGAVALAAVVVVLLVRMRGKRPDGEADLPGECTTCHAAMPLDARYCPACGDRVLAALPHRPAGSP